MPAGDFVAVLRRLAEHKVDFVVVEGVAAVLQGAPVMTFDLDVVHSTEPTNVERLRAALRAIHAVYRAQPERRLQPEASHLSSPGHQLLITDFGPLDLLGSIGRNRTYRDLAAHAEALEVAPGFHVLVLDLATQVEVKEEVGGEKDRAVLPLLRRTLAEKRAQIATAAGACAPAAAVVA